MVAAAGEDHCSLLQIGAVKESLLLPWSPEPIVLGRWRSEKAEIHTALVKVILLGGKPQGLVRT